MKPNLGTDVIAGGYSIPANWPRVIDVAKWDGREWSSLGNGIIGNSHFERDPISGTGHQVFGVLAIAPRGRDHGCRLHECVAVAFLGTDLYVGGYFTRAGGAEVNNIARWDGREWSGVGSGIDGVVNALVVTGDALYAGGSFTHAGGVEVNHIAKWDGNAWSSIGTGLGESAGVFALAASGAHVYAGGSFDMNSLARWDGSAWTFFGSKLTHDGVYALAVSGNQLYVGGGSAIYGGKYTLGFARAFLDGVPPLEVAHGRATVFFRDIPAGGNSIERTTDLETWEHLATRYAGLTGGIDFLDENAPGPSSYYRAVPWNPE